MHMHAGFKPYICDVKGCEAAFGEKSKLKEHQRKHDGVKAYSCDLCPALYADGSGLRRHKERKHGILKPVVKAGIVLPLDDINDTSNVNNLLPGDDLAFANHEDEGQTLKDFIAIADAEGKIATSILTKFNF